MTAVLFYAIIYGIEVNKMEHTKLTIRISKSRLEKAKVFAKQNKTSLSRLVDEFLGQLPENSQPKNTQIVSRLSGVLAQKVTLTDYTNHLEKKYLG